VQHNFAPVMFRDFVISAASNVTSDLKIVSLFFLDIPSQPFSNPVLKARNTCSLDKLLGRDFSVLCKKCDSFHSHTVATPLFLLPLVLVSFGAL
jgi:hypothetical protein